jgi:hypothetical protein
MKQYVLYTAISLSINGFSQHGQPAISVDSITMVRGNVNEELRISNSDIVLINKDSVGHVLSTCVISLVFDTLTTMYERNSIDDLVVEMNIVPAIQKHGEYVEYWSDGRVRVRGFYVHGFRRGTWVYFGPNGDVIEYKDF